MPWVLAKEENKQDRLKTVLYNLLEAIRYEAVLLEPFMPDTSFKIFKQLNTSKCGYDTLDKFGYYDSEFVGDAIVLFERIKEK